MKPTLVNHPSIAHEDRTPSAPEMAGLATHPSVHNLFNDLPGELPEERFETLLESPGFRLERILSLGHVTPAGEWYDQERDEWVTLLQGAARLEIEGRTAPIEMEPGDYVCLPAHCRHRVAWTDPDQVTVWLGLHYG